MACLRRHVVAKEIFSWQGDEVEASLQARLEKDIGDLTPADMMALFMRWRGERSVRVLQLTEPVSNMALKALVPDMAEFYKVLLWCEAFRRKVVQEQLDDPRHWFTVKEAEG